MILLQDCADRPGSGVALLAPQAQRDAELAEGLLADQQRIKWKYRLQSEDDGTSLLRCQTEPGNSRPWTKDSD